MSGAQTKMGRRSFLKAAAVTPAAALPEIPCSHSWAPANKGEVAVVTLVATRERMTPHIEVEVWQDDLKTCDFCGNAWVESHKVKQDWPVGEWLMCVPPVVSESSVIVAVLTSCRMWIDGKEVDWLSFEDHSDEYVRKRGYLS